MTNKKRSQFSPPLLKLAKLVGKAMGDHQMIKAGDRILVAFSGGNSSVFLWTMLRRFQQIAPIDFEIQPFFVDTGVSKTVLAKIEKYFTECATGCEIVLQKSEGAKKTLDLNKIFLDLALRRKFNKIALGHHLDDLAEMILSGLFYQGEVRAMPPYEEFFKGQVVVIRPLAYVPILAIDHFAQIGELPSFSTALRSTPEDPERLRLRQVLCDLEKKNLFVKKNIVNALRNVKKEYLL